VDEQDTSDRAGLTLALITSSMEVIRDRMDEADLLQIHAHLLAEHREDPEALTRLITLLSLQAAGLMYGLNHGYGPSIEDALGTWGAIAAKHGLDEGD
jgi:hypothetical protein